MSDDLKTAISAIAKLHQDMEAIYRLANPSCLGVIEQLERTMEPLRRQLSIREDYFSRQLVFCFRWLTAISAQNAPRRLNVSFS